MWDVGMLAIGLAFFVIAIAYVKGCELLAKKEAGPVIESVVLIFVIVLLMAYLIFALLRPEKF